MQLRLAAAGFNWRRIKLLWCLRAFHPRRSCGPASVIVSKVRREAAHSFGSVGPPQSSSEETPAAPPLKRFLIPQSPVSQREAETLDSPLPSAPCVRQSPSSASHSGTHGENLTFLGFNLLLITKTLNMNS